MHILRMWGQRVAVAVLLLVGSLPVAVQAHVKWFSDYDLSDEPLTIAETVGSIFIGLTILSIVVIASLVYIEKWLGKTGWYKGISEWFAERKEYAPLVMRIGMGASLLLAWQDGTLLVPELLPPFPALGWVQFVLVLLLIFPRTTPIAGAGVMALYIVGVFEYGAFYMLDYILYLGVGYYLIVCQSETKATRETGIPALYASVGFSLCWVALEKLVYPQWGLYILEQNAYLTLGFPPEFFLQAAAFIEFALGFLLIICLLERPISLTITLVFFTTTMVFGKQEVIGHTVIHTALIVFILTGPGEIYRAPIAYPRREWTRSLLAGGGFLGLLIVLTPLYVWGAWAQYNAAQDDTTDSDDTSRHAPLVVEAPERDTPLLRY